MTDSYLDLRDELFKLNRLDMRRADYQAILHTVQRIIAGFKIELFSFSGAGLMFRARPGNKIKKPKDISEIAAPPPHCVTGFQRCNPPGIPMFYASNRRIGALLETGVKAGDRVYLSQWSISQPFPLSIILHTTGTNLNSKVDSSLSGPQSEIIVPFLDRIFTTRIHSDFSDEYKLTAAIAQILTTNWWDPKSTPDNLERCALHYSSVIRSDLINFAVPVEMAARSLRLEHVMELKVTSITDDTVEAVIKDSTRDFSGTKINWSGGCRNVPMLRAPDGSWTITKFKGGWGLGVHDGPVSSDYVSKLLNE